MRAHAVLGRQAVQAVTGRQLSPGAGAGRARGALSCLACAPALLPASRNPGERRATGQGPPAPTAAAAGAAASWPQVRAANIISRAFKNFKARAASNAAQGGAAMANVVARAR